MAPARLQEIAFRMPGPLQDLRCLHTSVWSIVRNSRTQTRNFLFAFAEHGATIGIIIRSRHLPERLDQHARQVPPAELDGEFQFALRANPVARHIDQTGKNITQALLNDDELLAWLHKQGEKHGFLPQTASISLSRRCRRCTSAQGLPYTINDVVFRGILSVTSSARLQQALEQGIGRSKAFGYGMLLLASLDEKAGANE